MKGSIKRTTRKVVSIVLALVMVISSLNYMPKAVKAADYSGIDFTEATGNVGPYTYAYYVAENTIIGWNGNVEFFDTGTTMQIAYAATDASKTKITINGEEKTLADGEVTLIDSAIVKLNPSLFEDDAYTEIVIETTTGRANIVLRKGTPVDEEPYTKDAFSNIEAEDWDSLEGEGVKDPNDSASGSYNLGGVKNGTCTGYNVYFSEDASQITISYSSKEKDASGYVEVYIDDVSTAPVATIQLPNTGSEWDVYQTLTADAEVAKGNHTVYLKFVTTNDMVYVANVDYIKFIKSSDITTTTAEETETAPDLAEAIANTPDVAGTEEWIMPTRSEGDVTNPDKTLRYYIAESYWVGGENAGFFNGNIYGFYDSGQDVPYGGYENNPITGEAYGFSADVIRGKLKSVWINDEKLTANTDYYWNPTNDDVLTIGTDKLILEENEDFKVYYITVRTTEKDWTWPVKVERIEVDDSFTYEKGTAEGTLADVVDGLNNYVRYDNVTATAQSEMAGGEADLAIDNDGGTRWESAHNLDPQWFLVDLGATYSVKEFLIRWAGANAKDFTVEVSTDGIGYQTVATITDAASEGNRLDTITLKEAVDARYVKINSTARNLTYGYSIWEMGIYGPDTQKEPETTPDVTTEETTQEETTTEEVTTVPAIQPVTPPDEAEWTAFMSSEIYYYYVPSGSEGAFKITDNQFIAQGEGLYFGMNVIPSVIKINGVEVSNLMTGGAQMRLSYEHFQAKGAYEITVTTTDGSIYTVWIKNEPPKNYTPTGISAQTDDENKTARITWTASDDAVEQGCTYTVQVGGLEAVTAIGEEAVIDISSLVYGKYNVTVNAVLAGEVVGTATYVMAYKDPEAVDGTLTVVHEWEKFRHQEISWTAIDSAVGYAIYTDGILYKTVESSVLEDKVPAWAFATENRNRNDQPTSVGLHNTAVVAILEGDTAPDNLLDVNEKRIIDRNTFTLNVNYIYGNGTDLWNNTGVYSPWNFTVCEQGVEDEISAPANVAVSYEADGSANLTINSVGVHAQGDQAWTVKAAIYDGEVGTENFINLAFDIKGPAVLAGQEITIKCIAEEVQPDGEYAGNPYEEKNYMFELEEDENGEQYAVIHYSNSFESTNDTYDLLFGLGLLDPKTINDGNPIDLTLSDTTITKVYGITSLTPAPVVNTEEPENSGIFVSWQTDVPNLLASQYSYNVYIDGVLATLPEGESAYKNNLTYYGYAPGEHTVKVESIYNGAITSTKETIVTIEEVDKPDLVVTNIDIDRKTEWHIGETVPIHITVKNIGTAKAEGHGHLAIFPYVAGKQHGHLFVNAGTDKMHTLDVGEEYTATFNYTISAEDDKGGYLFDVTAVVDGDGNYKDVESNPNNNTFTETFKFFVPITEVTLTNEGDHVKMDWEDHDSTNKQYIVTYYVEGETEPRTTQTGANVSELELPKGVWLTEGSQVTVQSVHTDGVTHVFALGNAYSDLIISNVDVSKNTYAVGETVPIKVTMKNVGVTAATSTGNMTLKPIKNGVLCTAADGNIIEPEYRTMAEEGLEQKLAVDGEFTYTFNYTVSETDLTSGVISLGGYADADYGVVELIDNSTEDAGNNITEVSINIVDFVQQPMDWTPLYDSKNHDQIYEFEVANSSVKANIEYKVLDTSFTDINYEDLVTKYEGYNNFHMSIGFEDSHKVVQVNHEEGKMSWSYTNTWFQQVRKEYLVDENGNATDNVQVVDNEYLNRLPSQGCDIYGYDDKFFENTSETPLEYNGNGFNFNVNSFAPGKYYIMSLVDYDENKTELNYITLAFRVTQELEGWSRIGANDGTDIDKLAAFYHDSEHQVNAKFYYDNSDLGLACITAYNGTHLTITTDTSKKLNDDVNQTKIEIAYGVYDEVSRKVTAPENWDEVCINPGIYGKEGTNNLQVDIASLMDELPIHSANGGATDRGYYFLKIYNDLENEPESFIPVPLMVQAEIPEIIPVQGLKVSNRGSMLTVSWTSTSAQIEDGFLYDVYLDDVLQEENVLAGSYNLPGSSTIGTVHQVVVKAKWCEQVSEASVTYEMKEPETEPEETIPAGTPSYPQDDQWVLIKGQNVLPISQEGSFGTVNAQIWYYTDEDISSVVGYNDYYIALNGSDKYFTGESGRIFVQNGENTFFASKTIYDNHYSGQMLMNAEQLFTTYGDWQNGDTLYYTVRVVGNNGNTYKDFYFKVIPTEESSDIAATGDWRNISGTCELPVKMGDSSELLGTVSFLDCPVATDTYTTGTNTYDIVGYNGYYMSIIGDSQYYTGPDTKISVSEAKDTVQYAEDAPNLTFTEKTIYDKVYAGQIIIKCADTFTVEYATTYYLLKVESGESVTYIPVEIQVDTGDVEVLGFQMNTNQNAGGVAENSPSFRVVSKASKVMTIDNKLYEVKKMGTIYAAADEVDDDTLRQNMTLDGAEANDYIQYFESTANGKLHGYTTTEPDSAYNTYFALTFKYNDYMFHTLEQNYAVRAYAVLDDGTVVYGHNVYKANMYEIAQNLYESQKMGTKAAHDFLYTNVLNVVDMYNHSSQISNAMFKALNITSYDDPGYSLVESMSYDIFDYARCLEGYTYQGRGEFRCSEVENELLTLLNIAQETQYDSVYQWIYHETSNYGKKDGTKYQGCYRLTEYGWDSSIDKEFYTE